MASGEKLLLPVPLRRPEGRRALPAGGQSLGPLLKFGFTERDLLSLLTVKLLGN